MFGSVPILYQGGSRIVPINTQRNCHYACVEGVNSTSPGCSPCRAAHTGHNTGAQTGGIVVVCCSSESEENESEC